VLRNGQTVQIITAKGATPNPSWVNFVVTAKARSAVRHYLKGLHHNEAVELGRRLLGQALAEFEIELKKIPAETVQSALTEFGLENADQLYEKVGLGERLAPLVARRLLPIDHVDPSTGAAASPLAVAGTEGLLVSYAHCCYPIPNDPIFAFLSTGRGIVVHRETCANVEDYRKQPDKWLPVTWQHKPGRLFLAEIRLDIVNRPGMLAALSAAIAETNTNVNHVTIDQRDAETQVLIFIIEVEDRAQLARIMRVVRRMPDVLRVVRAIASSSNGHRRGLKGDASDDTSDDSSDESGDSTPDQAQQG
jgi:GTP diphosphokinase / guanosine-3',5'-bis(diphosphate) 3'-diphosphatase